MEDGPERFWPADLVILSIGFVGTEITIPQSFGIKTERNKIVANDKDFRTNHSKILLLEMHAEDLVLLYGLLKKEEP